MRQTGPTTGRQVDGARPQYRNPMERLASRQHLGRIMESLEKTGAPEPLSCVNVALRILAAACTDCLHGAEARSCRSSFSVQIAMCNPVDPGVDVVVVFFFFRMQCVFGCCVKTGQIIISHSQVSPLLN